MDRESNSFEIDNVINALSEFVVKTSENCAPSSAVEVLPEAVNSLVTLLNFKNSVVL